MTPEQVVEAFRVMTESMRANSDAQRAANDTQQQALQAVMGRVMEQGSLLQQTVKQSRKFMDEKKAVLEGSMASLTRKRCKSHNHSQEKKLNGLVGASSLAHGSMASTRVDRKS